MIRPVFFVAALILSWTGVTTAQPLDNSEAQLPAQTFAELGAWLVPGETLSVIDATGQEATGRLANVLDSALLLTIDGTGREFKADAIRQVDRRRRDPVRNGILIGLGAGALAGYAIGRTADSPSCPRAGIECGQGAMVGTVSGALWGAVGGWITDLLIRKRETIYRR
jgi:hypothetical protein